MAEYTNVALQTVDVGQNVVFSETAVPGNCNVMHREGSGIVTLKGATNNCFARYKISFGANIAITAGAVSPLSLAIAIAGEPLASATMIETPAAIGEFSNVYASVLVQVPRGCCLNIAVENNGTITTSVQNANLIVERVA